MASSRGELSDAFEACTKRLINSFVNLQAALDQLQAAIRDAKEAVKQKRQR